MNTISKKTSTVILGITAILSSRAMFALFDDPEGPNLLIVVVGALITYFLSLGIYSFLPFAKEYNLKKISLLILIQIIIVTISYFFFR